MGQPQSVAPISQIVDGYFAMWNETDAARRGEVIASTWTPEANYVDPLFEAGDVDALDAMVAAVHEQFPAHRFELTSTIETHHDRARWNWALVGPNSGQPVAAGVDVAHLAPDGRLREVVGFFESAAGA